MHMFSSITKVPPLSEIAPTGQVPAQAPQPMHASPITYAIVSSLLYRNDITIVNSFYTISPYFTRKFVAFYEG
jgi:hypothetical protein